MIKFFTIPSLAHLRVWDARTTFKPGQHGRETEDHRLKAVIWIYILMKTFDSVRFERDCTAHNMLYLQISVTA